MHWVSLVPKSGVDSLSRFLFRAPTHRHTGATDHTTHGSAIARCNYYIHPFNGLFSRTTRVSQILMKQEMMGGSGISWAICKSFAPRSRQINTPVPRHWRFLQARFLPPNQKRQSTEGKTTANATEKPIMNSRDNTVEGGRGWTPAVPTRRQADGINTQHWQQQQQPHQSSGANSQTSCTCQHAINQLFDADVVGCSKKHILKTSG